MIIKIHKGDKFLCKKTVVDYFGDEVMYIKGKVYISEQDDCITDEQGEKNHFWLTEYNLFEYFKWQRN